MLVAELINALITLPPNMEVMTQSVDGEGSHSFVAGLTLDTETQPFTAIVLLSDTMPEMRPVVGWKKVQNGIGWEAVYGDLYPADSDGGSVPSWFERTGKRAERDTPSGAGNNQGVKSGTVQPAPSADSTA